MIVPVGDIFGSLGGTPDFGPADFTTDAPTKRDLAPRSPAEMYMKLRPKGRRA